MTLPSRTPWLPGTPEGWGNLQVKRAFDVTLGKMLQRAPLRAGDVEVPYLKAQHVQWDGVTTSDLPTMWASPEEVQQLSTSNGDLLVCEGGEVGRCAMLADSSQDPVIIQNALHLVRPRQGGDPRFLRYLLMHAAQQDWFGVMCNRSTIPHFTAEKFRNMWVNLPHNLAQQTIADHLDRATSRIDQLIAQQQSLIDSLVEKRRAFITRAVTRGTDSSTALQDSGIPRLGNIPDHWHLTRLKFVGAVRTGVALGGSMQNDPETDPYPYLRVANVQDGYLDLTDIRTLPLSQAEARTYLLRPGDVLMNEGGDADKLGRGAVWTGEIDPCLHQNHVFAVRLHALQPAWLALWISSQFAKTYFESRAKQSTNLASISARNLMELPVLQPPDAEQSAIVHAVHDRVRDMELARSTAERTIAVLIERRCSLIASALRGHINGGPAS